MSDVIDPVRLKALAQPARYHFWLSHTTAAFDPLKTTTDFCLFFVCVFTCIYWWRREGCCSHEQMDFNLEFHTAENLLQSGTAWRMEARGEKGKQKKNGWKNKEQQRLHEERDVSKAVAEGNIQYLKGWRLRQPSRHKLIWSATIISRAYQGK